jgi:pterin-4a-carbinolamine dehydratase
MARLSDSEIDQRLESSQWGRQDILVHGWNKVRLTLATHSEGGLTADFNMAAEIDGLA